jgi:hypothetical protein
MWHWGEVEQWPLMETWGLEEGKSGYTFLQDVRGSSPSREEEVGMTN